MSRILATSPSPIPASLESVAPRAVTPRVVMFSLLLAVLFGLFLPVIDHKMSNTFLGAMHMPVGALGALLVLLLVINPLLGVLSHRLRFTRDESLTVYLTCLFSSLVPGRGAENFWVPNVLSSFYYATRENKWLEFLQPSLKPWITPALNPDGTLNEAVFRGWYEGTNGQVPWSAWALPIVAWGSLIVAIYAMQACLGVILRAQWGQKEALSFPLLRLPLDMTEEDGTRRLPFFQNPLVWIGAGIAVFIQTLNGLALYFPDVPSFPLSLNTGLFFTEAPWNQIGSFMMQVFPAIVGISFLLTREISFSLWFFHLFSKFQLVAAYMLGFMPATIESPFWTRGWAKGFIGYQQVGALLAYVGILVWVGREHWKHITLRAFGRRPATDSERDEPFSYPVAFWGMVLTLSFIIAWTIAAGVSPLLAVLMWGLHLAVAMALTRLVTEAGLLFVQTGWMPLGPIGFLFGAGPGKIVDVASAAPASLISSSLMLDMRGFLLPSFVQSFKLAHDRKIQTKPLFALIAAVTLLSWVLGLWVTIRLGYENSGLALAKWWATAAGSQPAIHAEGLMKGIETNLAANWGWVGVGMLLTWGLMTARARFAQFPLHPIGLLMMVPFAMHSMWLSIALGWAFKSAIVRFGGVESARRATPLFLGLALGDIAMAIFWVLIDGWQGRTGHAILPF